ncbi:hypothetical protein J3E64_003009 [Sphingobium sp. OAS761]|uniref:DUF2924 domain-containing protein n=1 Tax=Sphingobium sp. OAS761 TaxID=2817901 RepID=UPI0020A07B03|nr:DUF2924 domain-containing protein [Sphingobium sp. OAS761]MCP1471305.1 hypothetical protein [Sphingobium sp. OAS761]
MDLEQLRDAWRRQLRTTPPRVSAGLLRLAMAHAAQEKALGGLPNATRRRLRETASTGRPLPSILPGMRLARVWQGTTHKVRYRYYVSRSLQHNGDARKTGGVRLPAREIETLVIEQLWRAVSDPIALLACRHHHRLAGMFRGWSKRRGSWPHCCATVGVAWSRRWSETLSIVSKSRFPKCVLGWTPWASAVISG